MNRISELLVQRRMKLRQLAELTGIDAGHLSRMRKGDRGVSMKQAQKIATALGVTPGEVLGLDVRDITTSPAVTGPGFSDEWTPYEPGDGDPFRGFVGPNRYWVKVDTDCVSKAGPARGDLALVDDSAAAVKNMRPLSIVIAAYHPDDAPEHGQHILRQFVPPSLLISNGPDRSTSLDLDKDDVQVIGVVVRFHRALSV